MERKDVGQTEASIQRVQETPKNGCKANRRDTDSFRPSTRLVRIEVDALERCLDGVNERGDVL